MPAKLGGEVDSDYSFSSESSCMSSKLSLSSSSSSSCYQKEDISNEAGNRAEEEMTQASSQHSGRSPNYMRTTTSSNAKKENLQKSARTLARRSSFKPEKSFDKVV
ncbi:hypothetical protein OIU85_015869 [Salix viminalis]|uniref:Uncharacterized protein n=1 Tax=Salix viminalis TaxID=40686 RepID=A0A9Q0V5V3_SALVM|nr:hypothetical protein OIU85_015869 [Salix viminalis]